ncbi:EAL domain-containing protein [Nocardioides sp.]|uniref:EAL domain-containing protein n=1 Tax=Nocardioides sp. TaxID=35761 RepID=UPI002EDA299E
MPPSLCPPAVLVVTEEAAESSRVAACVNAAGDQLLATHALTLPAALAALASATFDCVLVEVGAPDVAAAETAHAVRGRAGTAAIVLVVDDDGVVPASLDDLADLVLHRAELAGDWLRRLRRTVEHARVRAALRDAEATVSRLSGIVESVADAVFTTSVDGRVTTWNEGAERLYGYRAAEMVGADMAVLHPPGSDEPRRIRAMVQAGKAIQGLDTLRRTRDGRMAQVSISVSGMRGEDGTLDGLVVVARDISDRLELEAELVRQTMHDALTGLPNRSFLTYRLTQALAEGRRRDEPVAVLLLDLDQFRSANDVHGHLAGDRLLTEVAARLRALARPIDVIARIGGDEFVLVCPDTGVDAAGRMAELVNEAIGAPFQIEHRTLRVGTSIGIAVAPPLECDAETLLKHADAAMYEAKARGRARTQVFDPALARIAADQRLLAADLQAALDADALDLHYQPVIDLSTDRLVGVEALSRWQHPTRGDVPPSTFVPLAETHGFVAAMDRWVLDRACRDTAAALESGDLPAGTHVAVNLSARSLDDPDLIDTVAAALDRSGLPPSALVLEITETALLQNREAARTSLAGLRDLGAGVSLDDFGTGYSSLSFLRELPVTGVKVDRSFVRNVVDRPEDLAITEAIVRLARGLGLETIAEGIETAAQRDLLRALGCGRAQGFWWSPAVPMGHVSDTKPPARVTRLMRPAPVLPEHEELALAAQRRGPRRTRPDTTAVSTACCLRGGLEAGQAWLVLTTPARREEFARTLGPLHAAALGGGRLVELDAYETLRKVTGSDGRLDPTRYEHVVGAVLARLATAGTQVGVHAELGRVTRPLLSQQVSTELRTRLHEAGRLALEYGDHTADCAAHGPIADLHTADRFAADGSTAG